MARPTKLTPEAQKKIVQAISVGATYKLAAQYGGVSYKTFNDWMQKGEAAKTGQYREFCNAVKEAEGTAGVKWLAVIDQAAAKSWQAAAWKLERRYPEDYGRTRVDMNVQITWRDKIITALREGSIEPSAVKERLGDKLAREIFQEAGVNAS